MLPLAAAANGAATIIGNSRQNLGNLECWGGGVEWSQRMLCGRGIILG